MTDVAALAIGIIVLIGGAELVVRGAAGLARSLGVSPVVIGLTIVAFGTSAPELVVSLGATLDGSPDIAVGNVVGSNIYNVLLVLGLAALARPLLVRWRLVRFDMPLVIAVSILLWLLVLDGVVAPPEGVLLVAILCLYGLVLLRSGRRATEVTGTEVAAIAPLPDIDAATALPSRRNDALVFLGGLVALLAGAEVLINGASGLARSVGVPELVVGLTVVAVGTSMPELVTSVVAAIRGQRDLAVGNVVGSNLFNILGVLGVTAAVAPMGLPVAPAAVAFDIPVMIAAAVVCLPLLYSGRVLSRREGAALVSAAAIYTVLLLLAAFDRTVRTDLEGWAPAIVVVALAFAASQAIVSRVRRPDPVEGSQPSERDRASPTQR